jgi:RNA polymerase sigma factor (sigma-70 family)
MMRPAAARIDVLERRRGAAPVDEAALMSRIAADDRVAFDILYRAYVRRLRLFLVRVTRRPALVEDVLNDTMLVVWHKARTYNATSKVSTWIFAIAYRKALKALRRADNPIDVGVAANAGLFYSEPESALQRLELRRQIGRALTTLSADQRTVLRLVYYQGYACREIADIMGCPVDTVKTRMLYARRKLKAFLMTSPEVL